MEEDAGVKAPVTRLRRRLSVEQTEESKSPAVSTPTKKRGGRKAAKPELELIDENSPENTTTRRATKKTAAKDVAETEEKTVTPSRRTTRIKSNTSIISETALAVDSPRAKRAARRASTAGSDGETPMTPIRQTRRTRKDSASSIEKEPQLPPKQGIQIAEVIIEEPEGSTVKSISQPETVSDQSDSPTNLRKSPRLLGKNNKTTTKMTIEKSSDESVSEPAKSKPKKNSLDTTNLHLLEGSDKSKGKADITDVTENETQTSQNRLSISSANLIKELNTETTRKSNFNKSLSDVETINSIKKRKRTKSWATSTSNDSKFYSDSEIVNNKNNNNIKYPLVLITRDVSVDAPLNTSLNRNKSSTSFSKNMEASINFTDFDKSIENVVEKSKNEMLSVSRNNAKNDDVKINEVLKRVPSGDIKTMVFIEDSDSNSDKLKIKTRHHNEDQCVPVVEHNIGAFPVEINTFTSALGKNDKDSEPIDCEPMDIDETMPENVIMPENQSPGKNQTERKSVSPRFPISNVSSEEILNKSRRKSSITQSLDKSGIETKSTLILSQIKDSTGNINDVVKSPGVTNNVLSKSVDDLNITQENEIKKNFSMHYSTSTPLQDKNIQKFKGIHVNTSIIDSQNNDSKVSLKDVDSMSDDRYNNMSKNKDIELSDNDVLKELNNTENKKNKEKRKKTPNKESNSKDGIAHSKELKKMTDPDKTLNDKQSKEKDAITQQSESESENVSTDKKSKEKRIKKNAISEESGEEIESDDNSTQKSNLIDDEAEEADDDYESGDSQDESERRYEKENEIIDKGETLTTDEEFSDNSDYEKDSFIVSSNEEDEELLDGSDDDLSMSDNELKMTAKSKKKYDERKIKEQKKASKEMFASRHRLNSSNKSSNSEIVGTKKKKRQQISSSESEEDIPIKPKKNNRQRLDSTKETSLLAEESELKNSNKKSKHLPDTDSSSDESIPNEKEMTICNETVKESDPLSQIKIELKTPQKDADSTVAFIDSEDIINDKNESTMTQNELLDPLQATQAGDEDDDSLSSDNENIIQNYDSVLQDLNKSSKLETVCDFSLNIDNKRKKKVKNAIIDELNLTLLKSAKKPKIKREEKDNDINQEKASKTEDDNASSDSIDLHLLFSEDSNNSDASSLQNKMKKPNTNSELIIPLKKCEAKTDVRESKDNKDMNKSMEPSFNQSINNTNKKRKSQNKENTASNEECAGFFIDTLGFHADSTKKSHSTSLKLKENQSAENIAMEKSVDKSAIEINPIENSDDEAPLEISYQKEKGSKRKSKAQDDISETDELEAKTIDKSIAKTPASEKKIKGKIISIEVQNQTDNILCDTTANKSVLSTPNSEKKIKRQSESNSMELNDVAVDQLLNISQIKTPGSQKVKTGIDSLADELQEKSMDKSNAKSPGSKKKIKRRINSIEVTEDNKVVPVKMTTSEKKQRNSGSICFSVDNETQLVPVEICENIEISSKKRKRKSSLNATKEEILPGDDSVKTLNESHTSSTKKKRKITSQEKIATVAEAVSKEGEHKKILSTNLKNDSTGIDDVNKRRNKKRKERDEDETSIQAVKTSKQNVFNPVPRLPPTLLEKLDDVPYKEVPNKKPKLISTTQFLVQGTNKRKTKPSNYLEESIYLNEKSENKRKIKKCLDTPKVLPFVPTASTSTSGFTTNFKINVVPTDIKFEAQSNTISSFRDNYMYSNKIRRLGTYDTYKRQRNVKLTKF